MNGLTRAMRAFLAEPRFGVLATVGTTGAPRQTVMWFLLEGDEILFNTARGRRKPEHLAREPRVSLIVEDGYRYVGVSGTVRLIEDRETTQGDIRRIAEHYQRDPSLLRPMLERFATQDRLSYRFRIGRVISNGF
ncbi:MAG TPA: PPOX class F420-dependent oxidoreductase, partial [Candidatus Limnocylindria bacterium]|nr:PPOX class F420-dependent oxidoreductase [Candidatus Limnocylindria bacterium]